MSVLRNEITLWQTADVRCVSIQRQIEPPLFEIAVLHGDMAIMRRTFERHEDAADFAIACMHKEHRYWASLLRAGMEGGPTASFELD